MADKKQNDEIPHFIEVRDCINCDASKHHKKKTGFDYGYDHESLFACLMCRDYGYSLLNPFYDPEEAVRLAKKDGRPEIIEKARGYCQHVKEMFGKHYEKLGISIDDIVKQPY
jgi:hypothetical protein